MLSSILAIMIAVQGVSGGIVKVPESVTPDVLSRREMMRSASKDIDNAGSDFLPLIEAGLQDSDAQVRFSAIGALTQLNLKIANALPGKGPKVDSRGRVSLSKILLQTLNDSDFRIRGGAVKALSFIANPPPPEVRTALQLAYRREREASVRTAIISDLSTYSSGSPDIQQILIDALSDASPDVRRVAALGIAKFHPDAALPRIVAELASGQTETRSEFLHALESYGVSAKPHLQLLETLLTNEKRDTYKEQIRHAISTIQNSRN
jgi:HEAT repeat protein